jgi:hypothetical protein
MMDDGDRPPGAASGGAMPHCRDEIARPVVELAPAVTTRGTRPPR